MAPSASPGCFPPAGVTPFAVVRGQDLIAAARDAAAPDNAALLAKLKDRIVLVGSNVAFSDQRSTPLGVRGGEKMPGVLVQAQMVAELVDGRQVSELSRHETQALVVGMWGTGCLLSWLASRRGFKFSRWTLGAIFLVAVDVIIFAGLAPCATVHARHGGMDTRRHRRTIHHANEVGFDRSTISNEGIGP